MKYKANDLAKLLLSSVRGVPQKDLPERLGRFVSFLEKTRTVSLLPRILKEFDKAWDSAHGILKTEIVSARPMAKSQIEEIKKNMGENVELDARTDPALLGGAKIRIGDLLVDATLKKRVDNLKKEIIR